MRVRSSGAQHGARVDKDESNGLKCTSGGRAGVGADVHVALGVFVQRTITRDMSRFLFTSDDEEDLGRSAGAGDDDDDFDDECGGAGARGRAAAERAHAHASRRKSDHAATGRERDRGGGKHAHRSRSRHARSGGGRGTRGRGDAVAGDDEDEEDDERDGDDEDGQADRGGRRRHDEYQIPPEHAGGAGGGGGGYGDDDDDGGGAPRNHANDALVDGDPCRAPQDDEDFEDELVNDFPSIFIVDDGNDGGGAGGSGMMDGIDLGREDLRHSWSRLNQLIDENLAAGMAVKAIVDLVYQFYERCVRTAFADAPAWPRESIAKYILRYSPQARDRQADVAIDSVFATINLLRNNVGVRNRETGLIRPNDSVIKTLLSAVKTHASLVDARAKRQKLNGN